ncbi:MAG: polysaccharide biosynthesis tyrosine autokinase, partial [Methylocella sp.]
LAVVSPISGEGRTYVTANLAVAFSQLGKTTLLIDADLRAPRQHRIFNVTNPIGLSTILSGRAGMEAIEPISHFGILSVLPAGPVPPNPLELLSRPEFSKLLKESARRYEVILVDTAAAERGSDAQTVAGRAKGALIVARQDRARIADVAAIAENVAAYGAQVVGAVFNRL